MNINKGAAFVIGLVIGAATGSVCAWLMTKDRYKKIADDEIASVREAFTVPKAPAQKEPSTSNHTDVNAQKADMARHKEDMMAYMQTTSSLNYTNYAKTNVKPKTAPKINNVEPQSEIHDGPYIITPDDFAEDETKETITLFLFADGVLTDDDMVPVDDPEDIVGTEYPDHFGEFERDSVYVRNDQTRCDYEILRDLREYRTLNRIDTRGRVAPMTTPAPKPHNVDGDDDDEE